MTLRIASEHTQEALSRKNSLFWKIQVLDNIFISYYGEAASQFNGADIPLGSAFNLACGVRLFTPVMIAVIAGRYGLGGGISLAALFALLTGAWIWTFPESKYRKLALLHEAS